MAETKLNMDVDLTAQDVAGLASVDALAAFLQRLGYDTSKRAALKAESIGLRDGEGVFRHLELLSEDPEGFLRVVFAQVRSITAKARNDLVRALGGFSHDHLVVLTADFQTLEFVLIDKVKARRHGPGAVAAYKPTPKVYSVQRKAPGRLDLRILRRLTFTQRDALDQFDKLRSVFEAAAYTGEHFQNRALFADHYLNTRLRESSEWAESPNVTFAAVRQIMADARERLRGKDEATTRQQLLEPIFQAIGFTCATGKGDKDAGPAPDYLLTDATGNKLTVALAYQWDRWLDGPDPADSQTPDENPGASVVSILERGDAEWVIVTNGRLWRLYSRRAHSRSTNFYEVDLAEALADSAETDPAEAFRYWWLFFRPQAFAPLAGATAETATPQCWLDTIAAGSREYAKKVEEALKKRVYLHIVPHLAMGFLADRKARLGLTAAPTDDELEAIRQGCLTLLYRLLFMLYAESRDLLPIRESPYLAASLRKVSQEIDIAAGVAESEVDDKLAGTYKKDQAKLYDRLACLFAAMDAGDPALNVPTYNGGLFLTKPAKGDESREARTASFLAAHKVPDLFLAQAIDHLARDPDQKTCGMVFIDYKSLGVRQLGSIYEGLLEFKLKIADEDLTTVKEKGAEKVIPLSAAKGRKRAEVAVRKGEVYLANDKSERRASGSYYTPDHIVEYIIENTVGPVLAAKLEALRPELRKAEKTYHTWITNLRNNPRLLPSHDADPRDIAAQQTYGSHADLVEKLFDCKVLDMAMGSGHFLVEAVDFITDKLLDFLNSFPHNPIATALERTRRSIMESLSDQGVAVDPDKLTDVHLLKRHVLKRCIYGVDLNPMAVELAKVSLWLDAFTLGAPLSFLDHHLRCGNSLIGATLEDLSKATAGELFAIPYEQMYRAISNVFTVARLSDATAAEVHRSADAYAAARKELSGYQIILDIIVARHFGTDHAMTLLQHGNQLDLRNAETLVKGMKGIDRHMIERVEALAAERSFFHWELEFPEVFFGPREGTERQIERKPADQTGFDAVVGNPPYVRQETLKADKGYFKAAFKTVHDTTCDLYVYFMQREIEILRAGGLMGMIVANKWLRANYGRKLRGFLLRTACPESIVDFGHSPIFPDADTFPCVPIFRRRDNELPASDKPPTDETLQTCQLPRDDYLPSMVLGPYVLSRREKVPTRLLVSDGWSLENPLIQKLLERLRHSCKNLTEAIGAVPRRGLMTGYNEAFYIDEDKRQRIVAEHAPSAALLKPLIRGRDIDRWLCRKSGMYMITIPSTGNASWPWSSQSPEQAEKTFKSTYPSVHKHLAAHRAKVIARQDQGKFWWEIRHCDYYGELDRPKIVVQCIAYHSRWADEPSGGYINNKAYLIPSDDRGLLAILNSPLIWWVMWRTFPHMKDEAFSIDGNCIEQLPTPSLDTSLAESIRATTGKVVKTTDEMIAWEKATLARVSAMVDLDTGADKILGYLRRPEDDFIRLVRKAASRQLSSVTVAELGAFRQKASDELGHFLTEQLALEKQLAVLVEDAYGLTPGERKLLRDTRPVRDPIDVLESRLFGLHPEEQLSECDASD